MCLTPECPYDVTSCETCYNCFIEYHIVPQVCALCMDRMIDKVKTEQHLRNLAEFARLLEEQ